MRSYTKGHIRINNPATQESKLVSSLDVQRHLAKGWLEGSGKGMGGLPMGAKLLKDNVKRNGCELPIEREFTRAGLVMILQQGPQHFRPVGVANLRIGDLIPIIRKGLKSEVHGGAMRAAIEEVRKIAKDEGRY